MNSGSWHSAQDIPIRLMILRKTYETFQKIHLPCDPDVFQSTLEEIVPRLEMALYRNASSIEEYGNPKTVEERLEHIAPMHVQLKPLEVLWLQGLFAATTPPSAFTSDMFKAGSSSVAEGTTLQPVTEHRALPLLIGVEPSDVQTQEVQLIPQTLTPSSYSTQQQGLNTSSDQSPTTQPSRDRYTQSLLELYQFFNDYESSTNRMNRSENLFQNNENETRLTPSRPLLGAVDLKCHERFDDFAEK